MNYLKRFLYHGCVYTVIISVIFFLFALIVGLNDATISIGRYFIIIGFGFVISLAEFIFDVKSINQIIKYVIHYLVLFASFFVIFLTIKTEDGTPFHITFIFSALAIFTLVYGVLLAAVLIAKHLIKNISKEKTSNNTKISKHTKSNFKKK